MIIYQIHQKNFVFSGFTKGYGFIHSDNQPHENLEHDIYINIPLYQNRSFEGYVDVQKDERIQKIQRQEINPFFFEYSFFDSITRNKINSGSQLTDVMIDFLKSSIEEISTYSDEDVILWFDMYGKNSFPIEVSSGVKITIEDVSRQEIVFDDIYSKTQFFGINILK
jgi:hypothetical protein